MQPSMGLMIQPFMIDMQPLIKFGKMNQSKESDITSDSFLMNMGCSANNDLQIQINENMNLNIAKNK